MTNLIIISGPSGAGEDSVITALQKEFAIERVITTTTREKRPGDREGHPYYFIDKETFEQGIQDGNFFEWAQQYNGALYGVTFDEITRVKESGKIGIWKIEYQGVAAAKRLIPEIKAILLTAPLDILEARIRRRGGVSDAQVAERMAYTKEWLAHTDLYDVVVVNEEGKLLQTVEQVKQLMTQYLPGLTRDRG